MEPCSVPICDDPGCNNGECRAPNFCACEIGWEGTHCDVCVPLPGCDNGHCEKALECICEDGWDGAYCDIRKNYFQINLVFQYFKDFSLSIADCNDCQHGRCLAPNECVCYDGWKGDNCTECLAIPGCDHGTCGDHPNTCECFEKWGGHLCDEPICDPACAKDQGQCMEKDGTHFCRCKLGWQGEACDKCVPYWECPYKGDGACEKPNECFCPTGTDDPEGLCDKFF